LDWVVLKENDLKMKQVFFPLLLLSLILSSCSKTGRSDQSGQNDTVESPLTSPAYFAGKHKAKVMVLGVFHFANPGLDAYKPRFAFDILDPARQKELDEVLDKLAAYHPTKIMIEWKRIEDDSITNDRYQKYLSGGFSLDDKTNEVYQIGFKLARKLNHSRIFCSDAGTNWCGADLDWEAFNEEAYLKSKGQYEKATRYSFTQLYEYLDSLKTVQTLTGHLRMLNTPANRLKDHQAYLIDVNRGAGDNYYGADLVANWYRRNLRIFSNVHDLTDFDQEERLLLIYGAGHVWQLRQFFSDSPDYDYVEVNDFLSR
jgi:hypothetical protein